MLTFSKIITRLLELIILTNLELIKAMKKTKIGVIGLGYVGLPLAVEFGNKFKTIGFDINNNELLNLFRSVCNGLDIAVEVVQQNPDIELL